MAETTREANRMTSPSARVERLHDFAMRLAQFQFPEEEPSDADKTLEIADKAALEKTVEVLPKRRPVPIVPPPSLRPAAKPPVAAAIARTVAPPPPRPSPNTTQEIDAADVLDVEPIDHHPCSVIPVALDVEVAARRPRAGDLVSSEYPPRGSERVAVPRQAIGWGLGAAIVGVSCLLLAVVNASRASARDARDTTRDTDPRPTAVGAPPVAAAQASTNGAASLDSPGGPSQTPGEHPGGVPVVSVLSLPRVVPTTGTIKLIESAAAHRLYVDGAVQAGASAVITCGRHMIQVGSAGKAHALIIGCGEETVIAR